MPQPSPSRPGFDAYAAPLSHGGLERLEPDIGKLICPVLRGGGGGNVVSLLDSWAVNARAFTTEAEDTYARAYSMPGALRAGFEYYCAFPEDVRANAEFSKRKLAMPVLGIGGSGSFGPIIGDHLRHVATNVRAVEIEHAGHWVAEEQPDAVAEALLSFLPPPQ